MALHSSLPIYKVAYDLLSVATDVVRRRGHSVNRILTQTYRRST